MYNFITRCFSRWKNSIKRSVTIFYSLLIFQECVIWVQQLILGTSQGRINYRKDFCLNYRARAWIEAEKKCSLHMDSALNKSLGSTLLSWATAAISNFNYSNNNHINIESGKTPIKMQSCNIDGSLKSAPFV